MILQRDKRLRGNIYEYGCYFMSLLWYANKLHNVPLSAQLINDDLYVRYQKHGAMDEECYVKDPVHILRDLGVDVSSVRKVPPDHEVPPGGFVIAKYVLPEMGWAHFVAWQDNVVTYDPWGVSRTATEGELESLRLFT